MEVSSSISRVSFYPKSLDTILRPLIFHGHPCSRVYISENKKSWVDIFYIKPPSMDKFEEIWDLHPAKKGKIKIMGKEVVTSRYQQPFGKGYWFSGMDHKPLPIPDILQKWLDDANRTKYGSMYKLGPNAFNSILMNWYPDGSSYIGAHSDDEKQLRKGRSGQTLVYTITFQEYLAPDKDRIFRLKPKKSKDGTKNTQRIDIKLDNGMVLVMGGLCQTTHKHQVVKIETNPEEYGRRISFTARSFKE